jgi:hypothetical protein
MDVSLIAFRLAFNIISAKKPQSKCAWPKSHRRVLDGRNHYPVKSVNQARNALSRVMQHDSVPEWFDGTLAQLRRGVINKVKSLYPSVDVKIKPKKKS